MTREEYIQLRNDYGLFTYIDENLGFLKPQYMWGDIPLVAFHNNKLQISLKLDEEGNGVYNYGSEKLFVSEVSTARFFLNNIMKQRKQILENKKLKEIEKDFE